MPIAAKTDTEGQAMDDLPISSWSGSYTAGPPQVPHGD